MDDILSISKDDIFSINVKATKELILKVEAQETLIKSLIERLEKLESK